MKPTNSNDQQKVVELPEQIKVRYDKRDQILKGNGNPYKNGVYPQNLAKKLHQKFAEVNRDDLQVKAENASIAGRIISIRDFGKGGFLRIRDRSDDFQLFIDKKALGDQTFEMYKTLDVGDFVFGEGTLFRTKTNELSIHCTKLELLTKALRPLPEKFHGLTDIETRYRQRYADLIVNAETREVFIKRSKIIEAIRAFFINREYLEVETPMLHSIQGGAIARPFRTHHNALSMNLFMRIAPELYLKRLVVGGFERVFEINRNFRNEGISIKHNPEFTMLEFYQSYATFEDLIPLTEELFKEVSLKVLGTQQIDYQGTPIDLGKPWKRLKVEDAITEYSRFKDRAKLRNRDALLNYCKTNNLSATPKMSTGELMMVIFDEEVEKHLIQPTFVTHYPVDVSPLARKNEKDEFLTDRFELYIYAREMANAFSELNDPVDQKERFLKQVEAKSAGNDEVCDMDEDYIRALEYGLPPTAGEGIGIDRMVMLLTNSASIRDVILFPLMRPE